MRNSIFARTLLVAIVLLALPAKAQSPPPDTLAAAKDLIVTLNLTAQFKALLPMLVNGMKPAVVQGRANVERDFDAMAPAIIEAFHSRMDEMLEGVAIVYANNFSAEDMRTLAAFYKTPTGQRFLEKTPAVTQQTMALGQRFGQAVGSEVGVRMREELRKKGHDL